MKLETAEDLCILEDMPMTSSCIPHKRQDLTPKLKKAVKNALYVGAPCFLIDWASMRLRASCFLFLTGISVEQVVGYAFETLKEAVEFVEKNKHQIAVYELIVPSWTDKLILSYAAKPGATLIHGHSSS
jgi:hypothetical protein